MRTNRVGIGALAVLALAGSAAGQQQGNLPSGARPVDPGVEDTGSGRVGRVDLRADLRQQNNFGNVYEFSRPTPFGGPGQQQTMYMRVEGGLTAVFPRSVYTPSRFGSVPEVPPGTTFYIGALPDSLTGADETPKLLPRDPSYVDTSLQTAMGLRQSMANAPAAPAAPILRGPSIWTDDDYRSRLVGTLLDRAAAK